jgi:hypothetical protein
MEGSKISDIRLDSHIDFAIDRVDEPKYFD